MKQLSLPVLLNAKMRLSNFVGAKNNQIVTLINTLFNDTHSNVVVISGDKSSGKTHLLQGCTFAAMDKQLSAVYVDIKEEELPTDFLAQLSTNDWVCIDNIEDANNTQQQELFDLYNQIKHTQTKLIISTHHLPAELNLLKDLKTRLSLAVNFTLENLTDEQKTAILQSKMTDKNINIDPKIYPYLFKHYSRDLNDLLNAINQLDKASLQRKSNITVPLVKQVLDFDND
ncbi:DnaA inactivator Hda (shorter homolog of DnaA) [Bathymodiolus thermophilus thioautotrophic gill symbiont]|uniref:DnaA regulatory inactivator Hda n=1 Tax=Bathymodiolus thermophilus thioautotrophic gill symbiont TaxID=2360 RepID=UPI00192C905F|nr:DnaA regulatory inactivator Hda [Bathymodiolus thermophilus thioautotrophic gill symbiont]CAB5504891.1 DnaA inactivator Hda (shorter homolog of DnaA) [Bathymodiolus thermophilus thioautotrophic gill symbiont]